jgi:hypothetical protein
MHLDEETCYLLWSDFHNNFFLSRDFNNCCGIFYCSGRLANFSSAFDRREYTKAVHEQICKQRARPMLAYAQGNKF